jgi:hypothetical protein
VTPRTPRAILTVDVHPGAHKGSFRFFGFPERHVVLPARSIAGRGRLYSCTLG